MEEISNEEVLLLNCRTQYIEKIVEALKKAEKLSFITKEDKVTIKAEINLYSKLLNQNKLGLIDSEKLVLTPNKFTYETVTKLSDQSLLNKYSADETTAYSSKEQKILEKAAEIRRNKP